MIKDHTSGRFRFESEKYRRYVRTNPQAADGPPSHGSYGGLLFDARWKQKRKEILERDGFRCVVCQAGDNLQVHHRQYHYVAARSAFKPPWDYDNVLMITLCESCHQRGHTLYGKIPVITL